MSAASYALTEYMAANEITVTLESGPDYYGGSEDDGWSYPHHRWSALLHVGDDSMEIEWRTGIDITEGPDERPEEFFDTLISDAWSVIANVTFENWASDYGYDTDSRRHYATWETYKAQAEEFTMLIGGQAELESLALGYERL